MKLSELFALCLYLRTTNLVQGTKVCDCDDLERRVKKELSSEIDSLGKQGIEYSKAIQELKSKVGQVDTLIANVTALENEVRALQHSIRNLGIDQNASKNLQEEISNLMLAPKKGDGKTKRPREEFEQNMKTTKEDQEREKKLRRALEEENAELKRKITDTKAMREVAEFLLGAAERLSIPAQNFSSFMDELLLEKEEIRNQLASVREMWTALENKASYLQIKINETEELRMRMEGLWNKTKALEDNVSTENVHEIVELKLGEHLYNTNQSALKQRLDMLEYKLEVQQEAILGDNGNFSAKKDLNNRIGRLEKMLNERNDTEELVKLIRDQMIFVNNSGIEEISHSLENVMNETQGLKVQVGDLQSDVQCLNNTLSTEQLNVEQALHSTELNYSSLKADISEVRETLQEFNSSAQEQKLQLEGRITSLQALLNETIDFYINSTMEIKEEFLAWEQKLNVSTMELRAEFSNETAGVVEYLMSAKNEQDEQIRKKLDTYAVIIRNLEQEVELNFSRVSSELKRVSQEMAEKAPLSEIQEIASSVGSFDKELSGLTEKIIPISLNTSRLSGQMEDMQRQYIVLSNNITEVKQWAALYIDNKKKEVEKQLRKLEERMYKELNNTKASLMSANTGEKKETAPTSVKSEWLSDPGTPSEVAYNNKTCPVLVFGANVVPSGNPGNSIMAFRCLHIGRYRLKGPSTIACIDGRWNGSVPKCIKLPDEEDIEDVLYNRFKCPYPSGRYKYPLNCERFYHCNRSEPDLLSCQEQTIFDSEISSCVDPERSDCDDSPAIYFEPETGSVQISPDGSLLVNKGTTLKLYCISRVDEDIQWVVARGEVRRVLRSEPYGDKQTVTTLTSVTEEDSGPYSCIKNNVKVHTIRIVVRDPVAVECPTIRVAPPLHASYNNSEMIVPSKAEFSCEASYELHGSSLVTCLPDGRWSHPIPRCVPKGCLRPNTTNDPWIQLSPDQEIYELGDRVRLACSSGAPVKEFPASVLCGSNGQWRKVNDYPSFPTCHGPSKGISQ